MRAAGLKLALMTRKLAAMFYSTTEPSGNTPELNARSTGTRTHEWRVFWVAESQRVGTDWVSLLASAQAAIAKLRIVHGESSS